MSERPILPAPSASTVAPPPTDRVQAVRRFNRFYTRRIGVLKERLQDSDFTLTQSRLLWELAHQPADAPGPTATELARRLDLDAGYLSRLLRDLEARGLLQRTRAPADARQAHLSLSEAGRQAYAPLDAGTQQAVAALLQPLTDAQQQRLLQALAEVERLLGDPAADTGARTAAPPWLLRPHGPGDIGWMISRHGALYAREHGYTVQFEAAVAHIAADLIDRFDARREACWIAERDGVNVGCVALLQARDAATQAPLPGIAQLRLLLVEPAARGLGIGERLVAECSRFAAEAGYRTIRLWPQSHLDAARTLYARAGYRLVASEPHHSFGHELVGETWERDLGTAPALPHGGAAGTRWHA